MSIFEVKKSPDGQAYFRLRADNGEIVLSSERYKAKDSAFKGIQSVRKNAPNPERFERKISSNGKPYFVLKAGNHEVIGTSELYQSESARDSGIQAVQSSAAAATISDLSST